MKTIIDLFNEAVAKFPNVIAYEYKNSCVTFQQLDEQSDKLAIILDQQFPEHIDRRLGVIMDKSTHYVIVIFAAIKASISFVPIDPNLPKKRIKHMCVESGIQLLVYEVKYKEAIHSLNLKHLLYEDLENHYLNTKISIKNFNIDSDSIIYIVFTSGTTGFPKAILTKHSNVVNYVKWCVEHFESTRFLYFLSCCSIGFDLFVLELFYPICIGKTVKLIDSPIFLATYLKRLSSNCMFSTVPSVLQEVIKSNIDLGLVSDLVLTGERPSKKLLERILNEHSDINIWNLYGPTETTVTCTVNKIEDFNDNHSVGVPILNTTILILDENFKKKKANEKGEIFIGGYGVARGYINEEESRKRFIKVPNTGNQKFYRTGDIGMITSDGKILLFGRMDHQVKINGVRIELMEIEESLNLHPKITKALVVKQDYKSYKNDLTAFIESKYSDINELEITNFLTNKIPFAVIPKKFKFLTKFPISSNGKIDRRRLKS